MSDNQFLKNSEQLEIVSNVEQLITLLDQYGIDETKWRKTPEDLMKEIFEGETELKSVDGALERHTNTVLMTVCSPDGSQRLIEDRQEFKDGKVVKRGLTEVAEKFKAGENPSEVALRAIKEELLSSAEFDSSSIELKQIPLPENNIVPPSAYEGLKTVNNMTRFLVKLPIELYEKEGYVEKQKKKTNYMVWQEFDTSTLDPDKVDLKAKRNELI